MSGENLKNFYELNLEEDDGKPEKIQYHYGFYGAVNFCYEEFSDQMQFLQEYEIGKEPVRIDMLIINNSAVLTDSIGKFFKKYNVLEYKSPRDNLSIDDFYKAQGYACLYKGSAKTVNSIPIEEITVSLFRHIYPNKLFEELERTGLKIDNVKPGIYYVTGRLCVPAQIVIASQLADDGYEAFKILAKDASEEDVKNFIEYSENKHEDNIEAILRVSAALNEVLYQKLRKENFKMGALDRLLKGRLEDVDLKARNEGRAEGRAEGKAEGIAEGRAEGKAEGIVEGRAEGRAEERHRIKEYLTSIGLSPNVLDGYAASNAD